MILCPLHCYQRPEDDIMIFTKKKEGEDSEDKINISSWKNHARVES